MPYYGGFYGFDPTYLLVVMGALLSMWASARVNGTFQKYSQVRSRTGMTGAEAARQLLHSQGIYDVTVQAVRGQLTDHYDPRTKTVNLSEPVYASSSAGSLCACGQSGEHLVLASDFAWAGDRTDTVYSGGDLDVCAGAFVSGDYVAGRVQCFREGSTASGTAGDPAGTGGGGYQKGSGSGGAYLCGGGGGFGIAASAVTDPVRRTEKR